MVLRLATILLLVRLMIRALTTFCVAANAQAKFVLLQTKKPRSNDRGFFV